MEYGNITNSLIPITQYKKLQRLQNRALKIIYSNSQTESLEDPHLKARLAPISQRADRQLIYLMYRRAQQPNRYPQLSTRMNTRANDQIRFEMPRPKSEKFKKFPMYKGVQLWNALPASTQKLTTYKLFKYSIPKAADFQTYPVAR